MNSLNLRPTTGSHQRNPVLGGLSEKTPSFNSTQKVPKKVTDADDFSVKGATTSHASCVQGTRVIRETGGGCGGFGMGPTGEEEEAISYEY